MLDYRFIIFGICPSNHKF